MEAARDLFGNRVASRFDNVPRPSRSPDLSVCDFFLLDNLKNKVYTTRPKALDELKQRTQDEIHSIPVLEVLQQTVKNLIAISRMHSYKKTPSTGRDFLKKK